MSHNPLVPTMYLLCTYHVPIMHLLCTYHVPTMHLLCTYYIVVATGCQLAVHSIVAHTTCTRSARVLQVEVLTATVDLDDVVSYRAAINSLQMQGSAADIIPTISVDFNLGLVPDYNSVGYRALMLALTLDIHSS